MFRLGFLLSVHGWTMDFSILPDGKGPEEFTETVSETGLDDGSFEDRAMDSRNREIPIGFRAPVEP